MTEHTGVPARLLVVDDEPVALKNLVHILQKEGYDTVACAGGAKALQQLEQQSFDLVLTDLRMEKIDGMKILERSRDLAPEAEVIMITGYATVDSVIQAMRRGAYHYIAKPYKIDEVRKVVQEALVKTRLLRENRRLRQSLQNLQQSGSTIITENKEMKSLMTTARQVAGAGSNVVITGESGTGKELFAQYLHQCSDRKDGPMLSINCGVFGEELLANELFGHEKGAFTGAEQAKSGLVEMAHGGTLFLDEITEMSTNMQVKLLRVIQEREVMRVGGTAPRKVDVRFICATNRNLLEEVN